MTLKNVNYLIKGSKRFQNDSRTGVLKKVRIEKIVINNVFLNVIVTLINGDFDNNFMSMI